MKTMFKGWEMIAEKNKIWPEPKYEEKDLLPLKPLVGNKIILGKI